MCILIVATSSCTTTSQSKKPHQSSAKPVAATFTAESVNYPSTRWSTVSLLNRRTCPSIKCGVVGQLLFRNKASVYELKNGWARITDYYHAACVSGNSDYVDSGNKSCVQENGIVYGHFAEWVSYKHLSIERPADPAANAKGDELLVKGSDDYGRYKDIFVSSARNLISKGRCTEQDFIEFGGWSRSFTYKNREVFFTYCGEAHVSNRIYLDAKSGKVFQK